MMERRSSLKRVGMETLAGSATIASSVLARANPGTPAGHARQGRGKHQEHAFICAFDARYSAVVKSGD